jgi:hypothetical protein
MHNDANSFVRPAGEGATTTIAVAPLETPERWTRIDRINENVTNNRNPLPTPFLEQTQ